VIEGFRSMRELAADPRIETMRVPTLVLVAEKDGLIDGKSALKIAPRLPDVRLISFGKESAHEILRETDAVRDRALGEIDAFLDARAAPR
jgi:lysophospholipase